MQENELALRVPRVPWLKPSDTKIKCESSTYRTEVFLPKNFAIFLRLHPELQVVEKILKNILMSRLSQKERHNSPRCAQTKKKCWFEKNNPNHLELDIIFALNMT